eukprot:CAMPEP_0181299412 /NCGR_PEP_ID=MMETSP1101-20121128/6329_1 /TAXON_ID=46948 /ORGANISM="Rhodomonas abbreviata, Strain Caron Lab Isolate" /LENGTH=841 /DNA_ID=CAMNT_0023404553 /DNA_START=149 /DNA_END=2675 /DNA_ORIENTATION=+
MPWFWGGEVAKPSDKATIDSEYNNLANASSYQEWLETATRLDELEGSSSWKRDAKSPHYDSNLIQHRLNEMYKLEAEGDIDNMQFWLRSGLVRNLGGIGNRQLYNQTHVGTKRLVEEHQDELCRMLYMVCESRSVPLDKKLSFFTESRHALGKTALLLSGGASLGMYHFGVVKALFNQGLLPRVMSGSSAGAITLAIVGVRTNDELKELMSGGTEAIERSLRLDFFDPKRSLRRKLWRIVTKGVLMDVSILQQALQHNIGDVTFQEAYERTGRIINITISPGNNFEKPRMLNYLTAPNVLIWSAASASCALPFLFEGVELVAKNAKGQHVPYHLTNVKWTDGSLHTDLPINQLKELFNVNYLIVSQVNPHAIPFVQSAHRSILPRVPHRQPNGFLRRLFSAIASLARSELTHRCQQAIDIGVVPSLFTGLINQQYVGDITLVAPLTLTSYLNIVSNPTPASLATFLATAERRCWPSIAHIRSQCQVEVALDDCVRQLAATAQALMSNRLPPSMPSSQEGLLAGLASPLASFAPRPTRGTHLDLQSYFGTATVRCNSLEVFQSFCSEGDLDAALPSPQSDDDDAQEVPRGETRARRIRKLGGGRPDGSVRGAQNGSVSLETEEVSGRMPLENEETPLGPGHSPGEAPGPLSGLRAGLELPLLLSSEYCDPARELVSLDSIEAEVNLKTAAPGRQPVTSGGISEAVSGGVAAASTTGRGQDARVSTTPSLAFDGVPRLGPGQWLQVPVAVNLGMSANLEPPQVLDHPPELMHIEIDETCYLTRSVWELVVRAHCESLLCTPADCLEARVHVKVSAGRDRVVRGGVVRTGGSADVPSRLRSRLR